MFLSWPFSLHTHFSVKWKPRSNFIQISYIFLLAKYSSQGPCSVAQTIFFFKQSNGAFFMIVQERIGSTEHSFVRSRVPRMKFQSLLMLHSEVICTQNCCSVKIYDKLIWIEETFEEDNLWFFDAEIGFRWSHEGFQGEGIFGDCVLGNFE